MPVQASINLFLITLFLCGFQANAQNDADQIRKLRKASNDAMANYDDEKLLTYLTDDVQVTTGSGTLLSGKDALRQYIVSNKGGQIYFVRSPADIQVNKERGLAWETGTWKGYDPETSKKAFVGGNYSAMWTKKTGQWLIKSQLFVTLE